MDIIPTSLSIGLLSNIICTIGRHCLIQFTIASKLDYMFKRSYKPNYFISTHRIAFRIVIQVETPNKNHIQMAYSKPKTSFGIDQILDETDSSLTASNPTQCVDYIPRMSSNGIVHHHQHDPVFDPYSFNIHSSSNFASSMVAPPQPPPPLPPPQFLPPAYHVDQYPSVFQKGQHI